MHRMMITGRGTKIGMDGVTGLGTGAGTIGRTGTNLGFGLLAGFPAGCEAGAPQDRPALPHTYRRIPACAAPNSQLRPL